MSRFRNARRTGLPAAWTLIDLMVALGIFGVLVALALPAVMAARGRVQQAQCASRLRQVGTALFQYEEIHGMLPANGPTLGHRFSVHTQIVEHLGIGAELDLRARPRGAAAAGAAEAAEAAEAFPVAPFRCPADSAGPADGASYRVCTGAGTAHDGAGVIDAADGAFPAARCTRLAQFADGLSHTALMSERHRPPADAPAYRIDDDVFLTGAFSTPFIAYPADYWRRRCTRPDLRTGVANGIGTSWLRHGFDQTAYNHVLPPNSLVPDCTPSAEAIDYQAAVAARSRHGGVNVLVGDGSVRSVADAVDADVWARLATLQD